MPGCEKLIKNVRKQRECLNKKKRNAHNSILHDKLYSVERRLIATISNITFYLNVERIKHHEADKLKHND